MAVQDSKRDPLSRRGRRSTAEAKRPAAGNPRVSAPPWPASLADPGALGLFITLGCIALALHGQRDRSGFAEEAIPFRQALTLWGWGSSGATANPHFFEYPSLSIYFHWIIQACAVALGRLSGRFHSSADAGVEYVLDPTYLVSSARIATFAVLVTAAFLAFRALRHRSVLIGLGVGCGLCVSPIAIRSAMQLPPEALMGPLTIILLGFLQPSAAHRRRGDVGAGAIAGLLCGLKYSAAALAGLSVAARVAQASTPKERWLAALVTAGTAATVFVATTPHVILSWSEFLEGVGFEFQHLAGGHLGGTHQATVLAHASQLFGAVGPSGLWALFQYFVAPPARTMRSSLALAAAIAFVGPAIFARSGGPERYMVPAIPLLWMFIGETTYGVVAHARSVPKWSAIATVSLGVWQLASTGHETFRPSERAPVAAASSWIRAHAKEDDVIVEDHGSLAVLTRSDRAMLLESRCFLHSSQSWRTLAQLTPAYSIVAIPFFASGSISARLAEDGTSREVRVFDPAWEIVPRMYAVLDDVPVRFIVRNSGIETRLESVMRTAAEREEVRRSRGARVFGGGQERRRLFDDPAITVEESQRRGSAAGLLPADWWARDALVQSSTREQAPNQSSWGLARIQVYRERVRPYLAALAEAALSRHDLLAVGRAARLMVVADPTDLVAARMALIAIGSGAGGMVFGRDGAQVFARGPAEKDEDWLGRVLVGWGMPQSAAGVEVERYLRWRGH